MTKQTTEVKPAEMRTDHREQRGKDVFVVPLSRITVQEDFNKRADDNYGDIDELSESIKANGQIQHGFGYRNADGTWVLTAGHRRFAALHRIAEATGKEQTMLLMKAPKDNVSRLVIQYVENVKHPNTEWDRAMIIKGLLAEGLKPKEVIAKLGIPHYVLDYEARFREKVIADFADTYARGETPIPCVRCNEKVKFADLMDTARELGDRKSVV